MSTAPLATFTLQAAPTSGPPQTKLDLLNPLTRIGMTLLAAIPLLVSLDWVSAAIVVGCELIGFAAVGVSLVRLLRRTMPLLLIGAISALSMALYGRPGGPVYWSWWLVQISEQSVQMAVAVLLRVLALGLAAVVLIGDVDAVEMADALAQLAHLPARFVLGVLAGVRMLELLRTDWRTMSLARRGRGLGDHGRIRRFLSMAFALLVMSIRRGSRLATAMEARGFRGANLRGRTWARSSTLTRLDLTALLVVLLLVAGAITTAVLTGQFWLVFTERPA